MKILNFYTAKYLFAKINHPFLKQPAKMQPEKIIDNLFQLKVIQCHHILNIDFHANPKIQDIPRHKGNLFLGGVGTFRQPIINGFRITAVLSIIDEAMFKRYMIKEKVEHMKILKHKWIDLEDEEDKKISVHFDQTHTFIKECLKEHNVLVHCQVGISRSATILIAFLMKEYKLRFKEAFEMVVKKRKIVDPNEGFRKELLEYEKQLFG